MEILLLLSCILLSFSGFVIAFYGVLANATIENIAVEGMDKGIDQETDDGAEYYANKFDKWKAGNFFVSKIAVVLGLLITIIAAIISLYDNPWWTFFIVLFVGYFAYLIIAKIIGWYIQIISILSFIISTILLILNFA